MEVIYEPGTGKILDIIQDEQTTSSGIEEEPQE